ncbi:MAG: radical SAM protein [Promethearchaeia archaeon]
MQNNLTKKNVPYSGQIELTLRCNAKCPFCSFHSLPEDIKRGEMNTKQVKKLIDKIAELGVNTLTFTGGEPTIRKDLPEIIYHTGIVHDFINGIATNGYLMPKLLKRHKFEGLDYILTSLDYPTADKHDKIRGIKVYDKVMEMIEIANNREIKVIVSTVVMKDNIHLLEDICELTEKLNCSLELYPCEDIIREFPSLLCQIVNIKDMIPDLNEWASKVRELKKKYKHILTDDISIQVIERGGFGGYPNYFQDVLRCHVAENFLFVRHDGVICFPCKIHPILYLNAFKYPLSKIYNTIQVRDIIARRDGYDFCNHCRLGCSLIASQANYPKMLFEKFVKNYLAGNL